MRVLLISNVTMRTLQAHLHTGQMCTFPNRCFRLPLASPSLTSLLPPLFSLPPTLPFSPAPLFSLLSSLPSSPLFPSGLPIPSLPPLPFPFPRVSLCTFPFPSSLPALPFPLSHSAPFSFCPPPFSSLPSLLVLRLLRNPGKKVCVSTSSENTSVKFSVRFASSERFVH